MRNTGLVSASFSTALDSFHASGLIVNSPRARLKNPFFPAKPSATSFRSSDCASFECALDYAKERIVFEKPISAYQLTQQKLSEMALEINRGMLVALHLGRMKDNGTLRPEHVSMGKMGNVRGALEVCRSARQVLGGNGITLEYPVIRHMNNLESVVTYEGTHEVHTLVVGGAITGTPAFR